MAEGGIVAQDKAKIKQGRKPKAAQAVKVEQAAPKDKPAQGLPKLRGDSRKVLTGSRLA